MIGIQSFEAPFRGTVSASDCGPNVFLHPNTVPFHLLILYRKRDLWDSLTTFLAASFM